MRPMLMLTRLGAATGRPCAAGVPAAARGSTAPRRPSLAPPAIGSGGFAGARWRASGECSRSGLDTADARASMGRDGRRSCCPLLEATTGDSSPGSRCEGRCASGRTRGTASERAALDGDDSTVRSSAEAEPALARLEAMSLGSETCRTAAPAGPMLGVGSIGERAPPVFAGAPTPARDRAPELACGRSSPGASVAEAPPRSSRMRGTFAAIGCGRLGGGASECVPARSASAGVMPRPAPSLAATCAASSRASRVGPRRSIGVLTPGFG